jgi:hypothetical protein
MSEQLKIFILEDTDSQITMYRDAIDAFKEKQKVDISGIYLKSQEDAITAIKTGSYDAAILDLKLGGDDTEGKGNKIIREIKKNMRFPIYIMSGFLDELDADLREQNIFYKIFTRTEKSIDELLQEIYNIYSTGITKILGKKGTIDMALQDVFWKHFAKNEAFWDDKFIKDKNCEKIFLRHILECLTEYLESQCEEGLIYYYPEEVYINPPIRKAHYTGDILFEKNEQAETQKYFVILTPPCDMIQAKARDVVLGLVEKPEMEYVLQQKQAIKNGLRTDASPEESEKAREAEKSLEGLIKNSHSLKYHYLPICKSFRGGFINFQKIHSIRHRDLSTQYEIVASIADSFVKDIIARFSHYYSRQGQPDFNVKELVKEILKNASQ